MANFYDCVIDKFGNGVGNCTIRFYEAGTETLKYEVTTDEVGRFNVNNIDAGINYDIKVYNSEGVLYRERLNICVAGGITANSAYLDVEQIWTADQIFKNTKIWLQGLSNSSNAVIFNDDWDLHIGGETLHLGGICVDPGAPDNNLDYIVNIGNAGADKPIFKLINKIWTVYGAENFPDYAIATELEFDHPINIPYKTTGDGNIFSYLNFLGGNNTDYWGAGINFQSYDLHVDKWSFFNHCNVNWGYGIPEGLMTSFGVASPNWTILTSGGEITFKKSDFPWDGSPGTNLLKIVDTGISTEVPLSMGTNKITDVVDPTTDQGVTTKKYIEDNFVAFSLISLPQQNDYAKFVDSRTVIGQDYDQVKTDLGLNNLQSDISLSGATPVDSDVLGWTDGDRGIGIGTDATVWLLYKKGTAAKYLQLV